MSASLVGSEMCIRDRPGSGMLGAWPAGPARAPSLGAFVHSSPGGLAAPVSYTHLTLPTICSV
eukprot:7161044-Alexandrium_andersonii.AAC.1